MSFWTAIVLIVGIIAVAEIIKSRHRAENGITRDMVGNETAVPKSDREAQREIEQLRERIAVLEKIATDGNSLDARETRQISEEIEALRDKQDS